MPLALSTRCTVCKRIKAGDRKFLKRLYQSSYYRGQQGEPWTYIAKGEGYNNNTLLTHMKMHQALNSDDLNKELAKREADKQSRSLVKEAITHNRLLDLAVEKGYKGIKSGKIKLSARDALQAAKIKIDVEEKAKDRSTQVMEMVMRFASGELTYDGQTSGGDPGTGRNIVDLTE